MRSSSGNVAENESDVLESRFNPVRCFEAMMNTTPEEDPPLRQPHTSVDDIDDASEEEEDSVPRASYEITSYGVDFDVAGIVRRLNEEDITIPEWQRSFVWSIKTASSFVESLLLGLPVPGVFMGTDPDTKQLYVIDGQQRLRTLQGFYQGNFPNPNNNNRPFELAHVVDRFKGLAYKDLSDADRRSLDNSLIHAIIVRQEEPKGEDTSMHQIFKRLNSGGRQVNPHEIRCAVSQGMLINRIKELNENEDWRKIAGAPSPRLKDQELILRFMAFLHKGQHYTKTMSEFLDVFAHTNRSPDDAWIQKTSKLFEKTVRAFAQAKGQESFRLYAGRVVNAAVFDSMSVGLAKRIETTGVPEDRFVREAHDQLIYDTKYLKYVTQSTSDDASVASRLKMATNAFADA